MNKLIPFALLLLIALPARSQDAPANYLGRRVAFTMHFKGAPWLIRGSREAEESTSEMVNALNIKPGMTVCDLGCGNGYHTLTMAKLVGETGSVYAVDIQPEMLDMLEERRKEAGTPAGIIKPILSTQTDSKLPEGAIDLLLLVDVYHEFSHPAEMLAEIRKCLKPDGQVALVEYREEDPKVPIKPDHKMSRAQCLKEYEANGFKLVGSYDKLPWQHLLFFGKDESWVPKPAKTAKP